MARNYYCVVASLLEYSFDTDAKGFDAGAIRDQISEELKRPDQEYTRVFYLFYDVLNILSIWEGKSAFNPLGNFSREELEEELKTPERLPASFGQIILAHNSQIRDNHSEEIDIDASPQALWAAFYSLCNTSKNDFIRQWYAFDRQLRNICAAYTARKAEREVESILTGNDDINASLSRSSSSDFGLKTEVDYIDRLIAILENKDMVEKERKLDLLRWEKIEEMTEQDYFNMNKILGYCAKINIIQRWKSLDDQTGYEMFRKLIDELTGREIVSRAVDSVEGLDRRAKRVKQ